MLTLLANNHHASNLKISNQIIFNMGKPGLGQIGIQNFGFKNSLNAQKFSLDYDQFLDTLKYHIVPLNLMIGRDKNKFYKNFRYAVFRLIDISFYHLLIGEYIIIILLICRRIIFSKIEQLSFSYSDRVVKCAILLITLYILLLVNA